jgi:DNA-binding transcriptional regulator/RsmH inhibitor MraZ|tara:strand:+ start:10795 stop:10968 length:174 start_codon:yes stop_codon:yes gene_type:complete
MNIAKLKLDKRGRITFPLSLLKANNITPENSYAVVNVMQGSDNTLKISFYHKNESDK